MQRIDDDYYFSEGKTSLLKREADLNQLLLEMAAKINGIMEWIDERDSEYPLSPEIRCKAVNVEKDIQKSLDE